MGLSAKRVLPKERRRSTNVGYARQVTGAIRATVLLSEQVTCNASAGARVCINITARSFSNGYDSHNQHLIHDPIDQSISGTAQFDLVRISKSVKPIPRHVWIDQSLLKLLFELISQR